MKKIYLLRLLGILMPACVSAQFEAGFSYNAAVPLQKMASNIGLVHSFQAGISVAAPETEGRLSFGFEAGVGNYASITREQTFSFRDGSTTRTFVNYTSNVANGSLGTRFILRRKGLLLPFVTLRGGYHYFYSTVYVQDPHDADGCRALERESILKDGSFTLAYGAGLRTDLSRIIKGAPAGYHWLELSASQVRGRNIEYINTRQLKDGDGNTNLGTHEGSRPLNMRFINASTQNIHEHQVAVVYSTPLRLLDIRLTYVMRFGRNW